MYGRRLTFLLLVVCTFLTNRHFLYDVCLMEIPRSSKALRICHECWTTRIFLIVLGEEWSCFLLQIVDFFF